MTSVEQDNPIVDQAVAQGGAYEVISKRLIEQGRELKQQTVALNQQRLAEFGSSQMQVAGRIRVRTENNCIARDIVQVGELLIFGYNVFIGLKKEVQIDDVFSVFKLQQQESDFELQQQDLAATFLGNSSFQNDFNELYRYYKHTRLVELTVKNGKLLAGFLIGERLEDIRVFRWSVSADGKTIDYIDNRGERDIQLPPAYDFEWTETTRENTVHGKHPHVNILDTVFVDTVRGDLTIKVEDNTEDGLGVYQEPVEDKTQSLDDASIFYAEVGQLILLKIQPYKEQQWRHFVFNRLSQSVMRIDEIGSSCVQLPEDHGLVFPGGYYLESGECKRFDEEAPGLKFKRSIRSPNGEDVLYVFYEPENGVVALLAYNLIEKTLTNPLYGHGYALAGDGTLIIFSAEVEPTRVHAMQIWQTAYLSAEFASQAPSKQTELGKIGNPELVRGVSDLYSICRLIDNQEVSSRLYENLSKAANKMFDDHYWISTQGLADGLKLISSTAELVIDEFEKVQSIRQQSELTMGDAEQECADIIQSLRPENWQSAEEYVSALSRMRRQRGHLTTIKSYRYIDTNRIVELDQNLQEAEQQLSQQTATFLSSPGALSPYQDKLNRLNQAVKKADAISVLKPLLEEIEDTASGLDLLSELMGTLKIDDTQVRTHIIDSISEVYAQLNQSKARAKQLQKSMGSAEAVAEFSAQFKLFGQSITNALGLADTPERCDEQQSRLLVQLEELESQFSDFDEFLGDIMAKRDEVQEAFESHKQQLLDQRQRKAQNISDAAQRILVSIERRSLKFSEADQLNTYFASDALAIKARQLAEQLRQLESAVKADDLEARFKGIQDQALRALRDKSDIYEDGGNVIKLGPRHKFSVNTQELDLTIIPKEGELQLHLSGTDYFEPADNQQLLQLRDYWEMNIASESERVYRAEYLAYSILTAAQNHQDGLSLDLLSPNNKELAALVSRYAAPRYKEGYDKGVHDHDAVLILNRLIPVLAGAELLRFDPACRAIAQVFWANLSSLKPGRKKPDSNIAALSVDTWQQRAQSAQQMLLALNDTKALVILSAEIAVAIKSFLSDHPIAATALQVQRAADYLVAELAQEHLAFVGSKYAQHLVDELKRTLNNSDWRQYQTALQQMQGWPAERWQLSQAWLQALVEKQKLPHLSGYIPEAIALINGDDRISRRPSEVDLEISIDGLLGDHKNISGTQLQFSLDSFLARLQHHHDVVIPAYHSYLQTRQDIIKQQRELLRLEEFKAKPLSSFVRNKLINDAYLPMIGDNLAKQMGTIGESKRSDLMGLLMMISPPGYGKTTLMEYVANRLGLIFMKINCPSLGHHVVSIDPAQAPDATAAQELHKLNLGLEMGNNVMLYLDDIQHTNPEFLQKFISLCDGTRRIEGVWKNRSKTYDMRGKKFCVVMAGNPYTESGEAFKIPDMLANRADIYNLGDILGGMDEQFALSYIENSLTSNPVLAPLALREMDDVYKLVAMAKGESVASTDLSHAYSGAEINEITEVLRKMFSVQQVVLKVNQQYIASAATDDNYRTEPSFKLQGSYRNMNKMAEKISAVMNQEELLQMIADHYQGESQLLTQGAESNLLKLAELRGNMSEQQQQRWQQIKQDFLRIKAMGGDDADVGGKVVAQLVDLARGVENIAKVAQQSPREAITKTAPGDTEKQIKYLAGVMENLSKTLSAPPPKVEITNQPVPGLDKILSVLASTIETSIYPLLRTMDKKLDIDLRTFEKMQDISDKIRQLQASNKPTT